MHDLTAFEARFADRLGSELDRAMPAFDAASIASGAMVQRTALDRFQNTLGAGGLPMRPARRLALAALAALVALATLALAIGTMKPGGQRLAYVLVNGDVVVAAGNGTEAKVIGHLEASPLRSLVSWAPGGRHLATFDENWTLTILDASGRVTFSQHLEDRSSRFAWSADGARLAVLDGAWNRGGGATQPVVDPHLFIVSSDGQLEGSTDLPPDFRYTFGQGGISWSSDGRQLAIAGFDARTARSGDSSAIWIVDRATLEARQVNPPGSAPFDVDPVWLPNGHVAFTRLHDGIWQVDPATGAASAIYTPICPCSGSTLIPFELSPDGSRLAMVAPNVGLAILDLATGAITELTLPDGFGGDLPIRWTADGSGLALRYGPNTTPFYAPDLAILDIATGRVTVVASNILGYDIQAN